MMTAFSNNTETDIYYNNIHYNNYTVHHDHSNKELNTMNTFRTHNNNVSHESSNFISCCYFNARSLKNKLNDLHFLLYNHDAPDVVCICETWLNNTVTDAMLDPHSLFNIYRCDRRNKTGGGVIAFVNRCVISVGVELAHEFDSIECVCFDILGEPNTRVVTFYRPGKHVEGDDLLVKSICKCIENNCGNTFSTVILADLNCKLIDWSNMTVNSAGTESVFINTITDLGLEQFIDVPTRGDNILDVLLCNDYLLIADLKVTEPFSTSDHCCVKFLLNSYESDKANSRKADIVIASTPPVDSVYNNNTRESSFNQIAFNWHKADWLSLAAYLLEFDWSVCFLRGLTSDEYWNNFYQVVCFAVSCFVSRRKPVNTGKNKKGKKKCYPKSVHRLLSKKAHRWRIYKNDKSELNKKYYNRLANLCKTKIDYFVQDKEHTILASGDLGAFYRYVNSKLSCKSGIGPLRNRDGNFVFDDNSKADLLNEYFSQVCICDNNTLPDYKGVRCDDTLDSVTFTSSDVLKCLRKQKEKLSSGPDNLPPIFYKKLANSLCEPLAIMFNLFMCNGCVPSVWKQAYVTPIFKKGLSSSSENYRPISLTCIASKVFETTIRKDMLTFFEVNNVINKDQHGFLSKHSTCTNLIETINDWSLNVINGHSTRVAYIDFAKAFDTVCHSKLIFKLQQLGISGRLLGSIESFLSGRSQKVVINGSQSKSVMLTSGVPQGSVLGPLLFIVYINDLSDIFPNNIISKYFADDAKIYTEVKSLDDIDNLQFSLDDLADWANKWQLNISIKKCFVVDVLQRQSSDRFYNNTLVDTELDCVTSCKDLGVTVDDKLKFHEHVSSIVSEAKRKSFLIYRCFNCKTIKSLLLGYKSYVLPSLNYCSPAWSPCTVHDIILLESVQRNFTRKLPGLKYLSYSDRLKYLNLPSLELRRLCNDLVFCYKILHNQVQGPPDRYGLTLSDRTSRGHNLKLAKQNASLDVRKNFFAARIFNIWNGLPTIVVNASSVHSFKSLLHKVDLSKFLLCF